MEFCHLELELSGRNKEVAVLHSNHYTQVQLYCIFEIIIKVASFGKKKNFIP